MVLLFWPNFRLPVTKVGAYKKKRVWEVDSQESKRESRKKHLGKFRKIFGGIWNVKSRNINARWHALKHSLPLVRAILDFGF